MDDNKPLTVTGLVRMTQVAAVIGRMAAGETMEAACKAEHIADSTVREWLKDPRNNQLIQSVVLRGAQEATAIAVASLPALMQKTMATALHEDTNLWGRLGVLREVREWMKLYAGSQPQPEIPPTSENEPGIAPFKPTFTRSQLDEKPGSPISD